MEPIQNYRARLARQLQQATLPAANPGLLTLAWALVGHSPSDPVACVRVQEALPEYVEAEIGGDLEAISGDSVAMHCHLLLCAKCGRLHARLLQVAWLLAHDELPHPTHRPAPRLPWGGRPA